MKYLAYDESIEVAREKGSFPLFDSEKHLSMDFIKGLPNEIQEKIRKVGLRNVAILTVPPTGMCLCLLGHQAAWSPFSRSATQEGPNR